VTGGDRVKLATRVGPPVTRDRDFARAERESTSRREDGEANESKQVKSHGNSFAFAGCCLPAFRRPGLKKRIIGLYSCQGGLMGCQAFLHVFCETYSQS